MTTTETWYKKYRKDRLEDLLDSTLWAIREHVKTWAEMAEAAGKDSTEYREELEQIEAELHRRDELGDVPKNLLKR